MIQRLETDALHLWYVSYPDEYTIFLPKFCYPLRFSVEEFCPRTDKLSQTTKIFNMLTIIIVILTCVLD